MTNQWRQIEFGSVARWIKGRKPASLSAVRDGGVPYVTADYLRTGVASQFVSPQAQKSCPPCRPRFPVIIWDGSNAGEVFLGQEGILASTMALIQPDLTLLNSFFCYFFLKSQFEELNSKTTGSTIPHVSKTMLVSLSVPLPEKNEQEKIATVLWKIQLAIETEEGLIATARELKRSVMRQLFSRGLRGGQQKETEIGLLVKNWEVVPLGLLGRIGNGSTPLKRNSEYWSGGTIPWLTSAKVYDVTITKADQFVTPKAVKECHLPRVNPGSVLVAITGQGKTLGHAAVTVIETCVSQHIAYIQFSDESVNPHFIRLFLESRYQELRAIAQGGGSTKGALTCAFLKTYLVPFPERREQNEITQALMSIENKIRVHERKRATLQELFKTMLHKLMTGEIRVNDLDIDTSEVRRTYKEDEP